MQTHGGDLDLAIRRFGGAAAAWIDLSTGINRIPYPLTDWPAEATALPTRAMETAAAAAAARAYGTSWSGLALAGAQAAIQALPRLAAPGDARVLGPTYSEHARSLTAGGWTVREVAALADLRGAELAVVVNPNNPTGAILDPAILRDLARDVRLLVVDESFADVVPNVSLLPGAEPANVLVLRSFGKFFGLAGLRLGFAFAAPPLLGPLSAALGPWAVNGPALSVGVRALDDTDWQARTRTRLAEDARRLDGLSSAAGWALLGGTGLFRLYQTADAAAAQAHLARHRIWSRVFDYAPGWLRLGLPAAQAEWARLATALEKTSARQG
ncbi:MAG: threonine-phosphate decarboxylase CobD [Pseudomonadota bacterium]